MPLERGISFGWLPLLLLSIGLLLTQFEKISALDGHEKALIIFLILIPLSVLVNMLVIGDSDFGKLDNYLRFLLVIPIFFVLRLFKPSPHFLALGISLAAMIAGVISFIEVFIMESALADGFFHKIQFGGYSILFSVLCLGFLITLENKNFLHKTLFIAGMLAGFFASVLSLSRGPLLVIPVILLLLVWLNFRKVIVLRNQVIGLVLVLLFVAIALVFNKDLSEKFGVALKDTKGYMQTDKKVRGSAGTRLEMWKAAILVFQKKPLFGVGLENYGEYKNKLVKRKKISARVKKYNHPHSDYLRILAEQGIFGFVFFYWGFFYLCFYFYRLTSTDPFSGLGGLSVVISFMVFGLTESFLRYQAPLVVFLLLLIIFAAKLTGPPEQATNTDAQVN